MVEIAFGASSTGSLKAARAYGITKELKDAEILWFEWMMDIGYLDKDIDSDYRKNLPGKMIMRGCYGEEGDEGIPEMGDTHLENWERLIRFLENGDSIRVWYSLEPGELCGFYHLCTLFREYDNKIYGVMCPPCEENEKTWYPLRGWGMVHCEKLDEYIKMSREIPTGEIEVYAERWDMLVQENAPLRAVISGIPTSVNEDFYDVFLWRYLPDKPFKQEELIRKAVMETDLGINSCWYECRIQKMIDEGKLIVLKNAEEKNKRVLLRKKS